MNLPAPLLRELLVSFKTDSAPESDKRRAPRIGVRTPIELAPIGEDLETFHAWVRNISATGLGVLAARNMPTGAEFIVAFERKNGSTVRIKYAVAYSHMVASDLYSIGGRLLGLVDRPPRREPVVPVTAENCPDNGLLQIPGCVAPFGNYFFEMAGVGMVPYTAATPD